MRILDELVAVAVASDDDDVVTIGCGLRGQGGDDIVGLEAGRFDDRELERLDDLTHQAHLLAQDVGSGFVVGLVRVDASCRNVGCGRSNVTPIRSGRWSRTRLSSIDVKPYTALVI